MKKIINKAAIALVVALGVIAGSANAADCIWDNYGNWVCLPHHCEPVWIQTGPFAGQGYFTRACN